MQEQNPEQNRPGLVQMRVNPLTYEYIWVNETFLKLAGENPTLEGKGTLDFVRKSEHRQHKEAMKKLKGGQPLITNRSLMFPDGPHMFKWCSNPVKKNGKVEEIYMIGQMI